MRYRNGFTLIELLVVIGIIGILAALVTGVGTYVYKEGARRNTKATQAIVMSAIERFFEVADEYPDDQPIGGFVLPGDTRILLYHLAGKDSTSYSPAMNAQIKKATTQTLLHLSQDAFDGLTLRDGWGTPMRYSATGGFGARPIVLSGGPDKDLLTKDDNIRSDDN